MKRTYKITPENDRKVKKLAGRRLVKVGGIAKSVRFTEGDVVNEAISQYKK